MTRIRLMRLAAGAAMALLLAACASTPLEEQPPAPVADSGAQPGASSGASGTDARAVARVDATTRGVDPLSDPASPLSKRSIYFDFDSFLVKPDYQAVVEAHGKYLVANPARRVTIEGHADDRGSREYNLALGQKRAEAVKSRLRLLGVPEAQVETVSFGEEKPAATGSDESAWSQNRRADINYK